MNDIMWVMLIVLAVLAAGAAFLWQWAWRKSHAHPQVFETRHGDPNLHS